MKKRFAYLLLLVLFCLLLCGCAKKIVLSSTEVTDSDQSITAVVTPEDLALLEGMENLASADFSGSNCYDEMMDWAERHPGVEVRYTVPFPGGTTAENTAVTLDLTGLTDADAEEAMETLAYLPLLKSVNLGSDKADYPQRPLSRFPTAFRSYPFPITAVFSEKKAICRNRCWICLPFRLKKSCLLWIQLPYCGT